MFCFVLLLFLDTRWSSVSVTGLVPWGHRATDWLSINTFAQQSVLESSKDSAGFYCRLSPVGGRFAVTLGLRSSILPLVCQ